MTLDELKKEKLYVVLSPQQQLYVIARCLGQEKIPAAHEAWKCTSDESALASANRAERNGNVRWLINEFFGGNLPTREDVIKQAWDLAKSATDYKDKLNALKLVASISGFETPTPDPPVPPTPKDEDEDEQTFEFSSDQGAGTAKVS